MTANWRAWNWDEMVGSPKGLEYNRRELAHLDLILERYVRGRGACVQAGGNLGIFPKRLAQEFRAVYTFEPDAENFHSLCRNCWEPNVYKFQAALAAGSSNSTVSQGRRDGKSATHEGTRHLTGEPGDVMALPIDAFRFEALDLLYLDVEGYEAIAIKGARSTIMRHSPVVVLEVNKQSEAVGYSAEQIEEIVRGLGYERVAIIGSDRVFLPKGVAK